jgi:NAD(P)-dependent dehydrogenase (short-subunit alcohol dehydrogenase family)
VVEAFLLHGARVEVLDRDEKGLAALQVGADPERLGIHHVDLTSSEAVTLLGELGATDILVNNVGHFVRPPVDFAVEEPQGWESIEAVNLTHVLAATRAVLPAMIGGGRGGSIINLTTVEAFRGIPGHAVYSACKAAVVHFGRSLAVEVGRHGIRVNDVAPDLIETPQLPYSDLVPEEERWRWRTWAPLGRPGRPSDVAGAVLFLASPLATFVTGTTIHVDGGTRAAGGWYPRETGGWTNRPLDP